MSNFWSKGHDRKIESKYTSESDSHDGQFGQARKHSEPINSISKAIIPTDEFDASRILRHFRITYKHRNEGFEAGEKPLGFFEIAETNCSSLRSVLTTRQ